MPSILNATTNSGLVTSADNSGSLQLQTNNGTTAVTIDTSQNVGIGTTSPDSSNKLQVAGDIGLSWATDKFIGMKFGSGGSYKMGLMLKDSSRECKVWSQSVDSDDKITFYTGSTPSERMRINSTGTVLVGKTAVADGTSGLTFYGGAAGSIGLGTNGSAGTNQLEFFRGTEGSLTRVGSVQTTGSATSYNTSSDYRLKENIAPMTGALATVAQLKPVTYKWKSDGSNGQGFIAHELQAVVPDCVTGEKDAVETYTDEDGIEHTRPKYQGVDTSFLVATLTAAIQEQQAQIEELKAEVQALKGVA